jgi:hypothetical protein
MLKIDARAYKKWLEVRLRRKILEDAKSCSLENTVLDGVFDTSRIRVWDGVPILTPDLERPA